VKAKLEMLRFEMPWIEVSHFLTGCLFDAQPTFHVGGARPSLVLFFLEGRHGNGVRGNGINAGIVVGPMK